MLLLDIDIHYQGCHIFSRSAVASDNQLHLLLSIGGNTGFSNNIK